MDLLLLLDLDVGGGGDDESCCCSYSGRVIDGKVSRAGGGGGIAYLIISKTKVSFLARGEAQESEKKEKSRSSKKGRQILKENEREKS